ncbi:MAG: hypothetical protein A2W96_16135 [Bacteroidetes bacterium GWD2_40_43]|jgi:hypothetical protein|nr:MAG: hypothetical protein A2W96_16135 [Bacteroidetes bacterium GWD2_40_43]
MGGAANFILTSPVSEEIHQRWMGPVLQKSSLTPNLLMLSFPNYPRTGAGKIFGLILKNVYYSS